MSASYTNLKGINSLREFSYEEILEHNLINFFDPSEFHHGDCVGSDADGHKIVCDNEFIIETFGHPPTNSEFRAFCDVDNSFEEKDYLERNKDIVDSIDLLLATKIFDM